MLILLKTASITQQFHFKCFREIVAALWWEKQDGTEGSELPFRGADWKLRNCSHPAYPLTLLGRFPVSAFGKKVLPSKTPVQTTKQLKIVLSAF